MQTVLEGGHIDTRSKYESIMPEKQHKHTFLQAFYIKAPRPVSVCLRFKLKELGVFVATPVNINQSRQSGMKYVVRSSKGANIKYIIKFLIADLWHLRQGSLCK